MRSKKTVVPSDRKTYETDAGEEKGLGAQIIYMLDGYLSQQEELITKLFKQGYYIDASNERYIIMLHEGIREED